MYVYIPGCPPRPEAVFDAIVKLRKKVANESIEERATIRHQSHRYYSIKHDMKALPPILTGKYVASPTRQAPPRKLTEAMGMPLPPALETLNQEKVKLD